MKKLIIHLISDYSGQTVKYACKSALAQFDNIETKKYYWPLIRNQKLLEEVFEKIKSKPSIVLYTISNPTLRDMLENFCKDLKIPSISVIGNIVKEISSFLGVGTEDFLEKKYRFDENYFTKIDAIDYTLRHDDGQSLNDLEEADVILVGPSRTSKTPTSVYLSYNGFKTANIPHIHNTQLPKCLDELKNPLILGLIINPIRLLEIRETRMNLLNISESTNYTDMNIVKTECLEIKRICNERNWPVIDVSRKSIEETTAMIMKIYYDFKRRKSIE